MPYTDDEVIRRALEIRDSIIPEMKKRHKEELAPFEQSLTDLEDYLLSVMNARGNENIKTESGTAFKSHQIRTTMGDRERLSFFLLERFFHVLNIENVNLADFVNAANRSNIFEYFTNHIAKEQVKEYMEKYQNTAPPGIDIERYTNCNIRKA